LVRGGPSQDNLVLSSCHNQALFTGPSMISVFFGERLRLWLNSQGSKSFELKKNSAFRLFHAFEFSQSRVSSGSRLWPTVDGSYEIETSRICTVSKLVRFFSFLDGLFSRRFFFGSFAQTCCHTGMPMSQSCCHTDSEKAKKSVPATPFGAHHPPTYGNCWRRVRRNLHGKVRK